MKKKYIFISLAVIIIVLLVAVLWLVFRTKISKSEALDLVYKYTGLNESSVNYIKIEKDIFDNKYEVKLNDGNYNYEIEVDAKTGDITDFEKDPISNLNTSGSGEQNNSKEYKTKEEVKKIVLNHANINEENAVFTKVDLERELNIMIYEIEFIYNNLEYEYEIDAITGEVLKHKIDR